MEARQLKARQIVATGKITRTADGYAVQSQTEATRYRVVLDGLFPHCNCADWELTGKDCKHMLAVRDWLGEQITGQPAERMGPTARIPRKTYRQIWPKYNAAQTAEKDCFLALLADLCRTISESDREPRKGNQPLPVALATFAACYKVYSGLSARRFTCDLQEARDRGHISYAPHFNSVLNALDNPALTPVLSDLIARSAYPLRAVESEWAVDSSGFSTSRFVRWFDQKYGTVREEVDWVKAHVCCGTRTNVIAAAEVLDRYSGDSPQLPGLVKATAARGFTVNEVAADKAYAGTANFEAVNAVGGTLYAAFRINTTGGVGGLFEKMFHLFGLHREEYLRHYHRRSMIESTFSMVKRKFGDSVRAKSETAMRNEVLAKFVCHNLCCVVSAIYELGIDPTFAGLACTPNDEVAHVIRFPGA